MDPEVLAFAQVAVVIVFLVGSVSAIGVLTALAVRRMRRPTSPATALPDERLEQLQQSVDAIAIEVERIAEAQRFTAKLLAERRDAPVIPR